MSLNLLLKYKTEAKVWPSLTWLPCDESLNLLCPLPRLPGSPGAVAEAPAQVGQQHRVPLLRLPDPGGHLEVLTQQQQFVLR